MSDTAVHSIPATQDGRPQPPQIFRRLLFVGTGIGIVGLLFLLIVYRLGQEQPLVEMTMDDGSVLQLWSVTVGTDHSFVLEEQKGATLLPFRAIYPASTADAKFGWDRTVVWLTHTDGAGEPLDLSWFSHCVAVDSRGWRHPNEMAGRVSRNAAVFGSQYLLRDKPPFQALPTVHDGKIVVGAVLDVIPTDDFRLEIYDTFGKCVAEIPVESPRPRPVAGTLVPQPLPATVVDGDLSVTLNEVSFSPVGESPAGVLALDLQPSVEMSWRGGDSGGWTFFDGEILAVTDPLGNQGYLNRCTLSPHCPYWTLGFLLHRADDSDFDSDQLWSSGPLEIPGWGESRLLGTEQLLQGMQVRLVSIHGPGSAQIYTQLPDCQGAISPPASHTGENWTAVAAHSVGGALWSVSSAGPVLVYEFIDADLGRNTPYLRAVTDTGESIEVEQVQDFIWKDTKTLIAILPDCPADTRAITVELILEEFRSVQFVISPPEIDVTRFAGISSNG